VTRFARLSTSLPWHVIRDRADVGEPAEDVHRVRTACGGIMLRPAYVAEARPDGAMCRGCDEALQP
jgi:hypothetical protein